MAENSRKDTGPTFGVRHQQCLLLFGCQFIMYTVVANTSLAIVAMTDSSKANPDFEEFDWSEETRGSILSSFFWGYILSQIPCGTLAVRFGGKMVLLTGVAANCILNLLVPILTSLWGGNALLVLRILQGVFQGVLYPSSHGLIASWAPIQERSRLSLLIYPGAQIGTITALLTGGAIASSRFGWPGIFYIWGALGLVWCLLWLWLGASSPAEHKSISAAERSYILGAASGHQAKQSTPWKKIFSSRAFYALIITHLCGAYNYWTITTITPTYLNGIFGMDIKKNALLSAIPPIGLFFLSHVFGQLARFCTGVLKFSLRTLRIVFNTIGLMVPAISLQCLSLVKKEHPALAVALLTISYGVGAAALMGYYVNHMDLCPSHASILMGVTNSVATFGGIFAPLAIGWFVPDETNTDQWQIIFTIGTVLLTLGTLIFGFFGRFENQNWIEQESENSYTKAESPSDSIETVKTTY